MIKKIESKISRIHIDTIYHKTEMDRTYLLMQYSFDDMKKGFLVL